jgi:cellulose synthase/poly-beta-1,6-N-acetylglucosamine synthase-like glycosyltransferase
VVVSTYDERRWDDLAACVDSLRSQGRRPLEVIVVVDHNPDLLERAAAAFADTDVLPNRRSRGLAGARNTGIEEAAGEIVAFIDDDARAEEGWLEELEGCFSAAETVGAGGALLPRWEGERPNWFPLEFYWVFGCSYTGLPDRLAPVRNPIGANMAVRASVLAEAGGFREGLSDDAPRELRARGVVRGGGNVPDDTDLAIRVKQARPDAVWLYQPSARVLHTVTAERTTVGYFLRRSFEEGVGKASLAGLVGADAGLASERRHVAAVLPKGVLRELGRFARGDGSAALRALAIVAGTAAAAVGFLSVSLPRAGSPVRSRADAILRRVRSGETSPPR